MRRCRLIALLAALVVLPLARVHAAPPRVALLWIGSSDSALFRRALIEGMRDGGYVAGKDVLVDEPTSAGRYEKLGDLATQLVRTTPDVIVTYGATATKAAHKATSTIPIVMITGTDPVKLGLVRSLSRPGSNVTGVTIMGEAITAKRLQLLKELLPRIRKVAVMMNPMSEAEVVTLRTAETAARELGLELPVVEIRGREDLEPAFALLEKARPDGLLVVGSTMLFANRERITALAARQRIPLVTQQREWAEQGALLSYGADIPQSFRLAGEYVVKILRGSSPAELPFLQAQRFQLVINARSAKHLGITVPQSVLLRADEVIE